MVAASDTSAEARYLLGMSYLEDLEDAEPASADRTLREARRHFVRAFRIDPNHAPTLFQYASTFAGGPPMADEHINVLTRAMELAPQVGTIRMYLAQELMEREEFDAAVAVLRPLMYSPHSMRTSRQVRAIAAAALRHEQAPADLGDDDEGDED